MSFNLRDRVAVSYSSTADSGGPTELEGVVRGANDDQGWFLLYDFATSRIYTVDTDSRVVYKYQSDQKLGDVVDIET